MILNDSTRILHRSDYPFNSGIKRFFPKTPQVMATYLVNDTSDIDGLPHLQKKIIVMNNMSCPKYDRLVPSKIEFYRCLSIYFCVGFYMHQN